MNETVSTILSRRSSRAYTAEQVADADIATILEAGKYAPSAMNQQSWHFTVVQNKGMLQKINEGCREGMRRMSPEMAERAKDPEFSVFYGAPTLIIVSADSGAIMPKIDGTLALSNMLLAAESLNLGACWIHAVSTLLENEAAAGLRSQLGVPEGYTVVGTGAFGKKAADSPPAPPRKEDTVNFVR